MARLDVLAVGVAVSLLVANPARTHGQSLYAHPDQPVSATGHESEGPARMRCAGDQECEACGRGCEECFSKHRHSVYGEFLYLQPRDVDMPYATPVDGLGINAVPIGPASVADPDYQPGFRVGGAAALSSRSSLHVGFSHFESDTSDSLFLDGGAGFIRAETVHPNTANVASDSLETSATYDIDFDLVDLTYKGLLWGGACHKIDYVAGVRYGRLDQDFQADYLINQVTTVNSEIDFDGLGPRLGLEGERRIGKGFLVYGKTFANFLAGEFQADYRQENLFSGRQAATGVQDDRIVPVLELELGLGWQSRCGQFRWTAGYLISSWFNTMTTPDFINAVQADQLSDIDETLTFDGLATRLEFRF